MVQPDHRPTGFKGYGRGKDILWEHPEGHPNQQFHRHTSSGGGKPRVAAPGVGSAPFGKLTGTPCSAGSQCDFKERR